MDQEETLKYYGAAIQTDLAGPAGRKEMEVNTRRLLELAEFAVTSYKPFLPVRLVVFPEFAHTTPTYPTLKELREKLAVEIPNRHTDRFCTKARELGVYIQMGSMLEIDRKYPNAVFNTTCLVGPEGLLFKYRKVYTWLPWEVHTSPHDIRDYEEELFPVAKTPIGNIGAAICYDWLFPEVIRQLALNGAEVVTRVSAYMDPFGATEPNDWWTVVNRCRALENLVYVVAANQAASLEHFPPFSWPGGSMIVDYDGRVVARATPGEGEKITVGPIDISLLRSERRRRLAHQMLLHLRPEAHPGASRGRYPAGSFRGQADRSYEDNVRCIEAVRKKVER